ncbi:hypothetical protein [Bradyrhizobium liaoningense]|uniref:hypothetical protein n=1 Tax=Bradyrhizobium liaoningense TaxID=43992 RepID=UPI001BA79B10|nr:hypothetical protein [Bradyrhizobium liaoningense]MBR0855469.1 hypothetical protein [Bradyrhizobium liaoningense]
MEKPQMWNWVAAFGVLVELFGFATLTYELARTLRSDTFDAVKIEAQNGAAETISVFDGPDGYIDFDGGRLGALLQQLNGRQSALRDRMKLIVVGALFSGFGCFIQLVGSLGQAISSPT